MSVKKILAISFIFLFLSSAVIVFAQAPAGDTGRERSVEELYLKNPSVRLAYEVAKAETRDDKLFALTQIETIMKEGKLSGEDEKTITVILADLASQGTTVIVKEQGRVINNFPDVRWIACRTLSAVQSEEGKKKAVSVLIGIVQNDTDPMVKTNAAYSLGIIGMNENNASSKAIAAAIEAQDFVSPNDNFAFAATIAIERLMASSDGVTDGVSMRALIRIVQGNYTKPVKDKAYEVLNKLRQQV